MKVIEMGCKEKSFFDRDLAFSFLNNNENIYYKMIESYFDNYKDIDDKINCAFTKNDFLELKKIIHDVKGVSLNIGSSKLYDISYKLNNMLIDFDANNYVLVRELKRLLIDFCKINNIVLKRIKQSLKEKK